MDVIEQAWACRGPGGSPPEVEVFVQEVPVPEPDGLPFRRGPSRCFFLSGDGWSKILSMSRTGQSPRESASVVAVPSRRRLAPLPQACGDTNERAIMASWSAGPADAPRRRNTVITRLFPALLQIRPHAIRRSSRADRNRLYRITHFAQSHRAPKRAGAARAATFQFAPILKFLQLSIEMSSQWRRLPIYSIQRCGAWADMGQWVVSALGLEPLHLRATLA